MKQKLIKRAVSQCPVIPMDLFGQDEPSLLDSGSMVTLIREGYFTKHIQPLLKKSSSKMAEAHSLFQLSAANNEIMPVSKYFEADISILGFRIPRVGFLVVKDPNVLLESQHNTQLPGVIGCNLIWLGCEELSGLLGAKLLRNSAVRKCSSGSIFTTLLTLSSEQTTGWSKYTNK